MFVVVGGGNSPATITNHYKYFSSSLFLADINVLSQKSASSSWIIYITLKQRNANFPPDVLPFFFHLVVFEFIFIFIFPFSFSPEELREREREREKESTCECPFLSNPILSCLLFLIDMGLPPSQIPRYK
jgi:hypothetical protein